MARSIWTGTLSLGLVNVPVSLFSAVTAKTVKFNQISGKTGGRIKQKRVDETTGDEVAFEDIIKGFEITKDRYITVEPSELDALAPRKTKTLELSGFVPLEQIDPMIYDKSYYVGPVTGGLKAYKLLAQAMESSGRVGIGTVILRSKETLMAVRAIDGRLLLSTLVFSDEINGFDFDDDGAEVSDKELSMAQGLIDSLTEDFDHKAYADSYRAQVLDLIERKAAGEEIVTSAAAEEPAEAPDLMAALTASLEAVETKKAPKKAPAKPRARKAKTTA